MLVAVHAALVLAVSPSEFFYAVHEGQTSFVKHLINVEGADVNMKNDHGETALLMAAHEGHDSMVSLLLDKGANPNAASQSRETPIVWACFWEHEPVVKRLIRAGANIEAKDRYGETPLIWAAHHRKLKSMQWLMEAGADMNARNRRGLTILENARELGHHAVVGMLTGGKLEEMEVDEMETGAAHHGEDQDMEALMEGRKTEL